MTRRLSTIMDDYVSPPTGRLPRGKRKPGADKRDRSNFKYGIEMPKDFASAVRLDVAGGNTLWQDK